MKTIESKFLKFTKNKKLADCHKNSNFLLIIKIFEKECQKVFIIATKALKINIFYFLFGTKSLTLTFLWKELRETFLLECIEKQILVSIF